VSKPVVTRTSDMDNSLSPTHYMAQPTTATVQHRISFIHVACSNELGIKPTDFDDPSCTLMSIFMKRDRAAIVIPRPSIQRDELPLMGMAILRGVETGHAIVCENSRV